MQRALTLLLLMLGPIGFVGCSAAPPVPAEGQAQALAFSADQYPAVHAAAVEVLRHHGFEIARNDYRFGRVTTQPKESPTFVEFWIDDASTGDQKRADTLNQQQRRVSVRVDRVGAEKGDADQPAEPLGYRLTVQATIERLQQPDRYLTHSARGRMTRVYTTTPQHLADRGIKPGDAREIERDPYLERRLLEAIRDAVKR